jgi:hypothetical protein
MIVMACPLAESRVPTLPALRTIAENGGPNHRLHPKTLVCEVTSFVSYINHVSSLGS